MVSPQIIIEAATILLQADPITVLVCGFGMSVVLLFSVVYIWQHAKEERP